MNCTISATTPASPPLLLGGEHFLLVIYLKWELILIFIIQHFLDGLRYGGKPRTTPASPPLLEGWEHFRLESCLRLVISIMKCVFRGIYSGRGINISIEI